MGIQIRLLRDEERVLANAFFNRIYQSDRSTEVFNWEFVNGPSGKAIYIVAVDDTETASTKIVGIQCAIPVEFTKATGEVVLTAKSEDTLVDPSYRGQKIFEKMYDVLFEESRKAGIQYIWGFTPADKAFSRIGFEIPFKTQQAVAVSKPVSAYHYLASLNPSNSAKQKFKILGLSMLSWLKSAFKGSADANLQLKEGDFTTLDATFKSVFRETKMFNLHCTPAFVQWRLLTNPYKNNYINFVVTNKNEVVGNILCNVRKDVSYIEMILLNDQRILPAALRMAMKRLRQKSSVVRALCFDTNHVLSGQIKALDAAGFTTLDRGNYFVWKNLTDIDTVQSKDLFLNRLFTQGNL